MEYQGFVVDAFERDAGKWRAKILRSSGKSVITGRKRIWRFVTGVDAATAPAALSWPLKPSTQEHSRVRRRCQKNSGAIMATAKMAPDKRGASIAAGQTKSPGDQDGAKSEAGLLTICNPTRSEMVNACIGPTDWQHCTTRAKTALVKKKRPRTRGSALGALSLFGRGHVTVPPAPRICLRIWVDKRGEHSAGPALSTREATWQIGPQTRHQKEPQARCISVAGYGRPAGYSGRVRCRGHPTLQRLPGRPRSSSYKGEG